MTKLDNLSVFMIGHLSRKEVLAGKSVRMTLSGDGESDRKGGQLG